MLKAILTKLPMISCHRAAELLSKRMDKGLSLPETLSLFIHLGVCDACHAVSRQFAQMRQAFRNYYKALISGDQPERTLPADARSRIVEQLKKA